MPINNLGIELYDEKKAQDDRLKNFLSNQKDLGQQQMISKDNAAKLAQEKELKTREYDILEGYRTDQGTHMREGDKVDKLKALLGGSGGTAGTTSADAQRLHNLVDTGRQSLNTTEDLAKEHPIAYAAESITPQFLVNKIGGNMKKIADAKAGTKEALQNAYTGAAASGEQVPAFQGWSGPGVWDALSGNVNQDGSAQIRDSMNTLQQGTKKQTRGLSPEMANAAGLGNDPMVKQHLAEQAQRAEVAKQQQLMKMDPIDRALYEDIRAKPDHPARKNAETFLTRKYGAIF